MLLSISPTTISAETGDLGHVRRQHSHQILMRRECIRAIPYGLSLEG